ncbi:MAG TPA: glycosyltransferase [Thermoanaerobaculia bacterium]|nr:glycosyltransferase [Thermoanaerobaculia bacterium]
MRVLIASHYLAAMGGVQSSERDLALWLLARGHSPVVYATHLGDAAREFLQRTIPVIDDLDNVTAPIDIIHGDSPIETMAALLRFPNVPAIFVCHGWGGIERSTPRFPRILRYVAVDDTCADRLMLREGVELERLSVLLNAVDLATFAQRAPLPPRPRRAVAFSNTAHELTFLPAIREACRRASIELDVLGAYSGNTSLDPQSILGQYDLAFAKAKCALEAMASGLAVILCDVPGLGGLVRSADVDRLRRLNFGIRTLNQPLTVESLLAELALYDPNDARAVSDRIRQTAASDFLHQSLFELYESVIEEHARNGANGDVHAEERAAAAFLHQLAVDIRSRDGRMLRVTSASHRILQTPVVGPMASRVLRWLMRRR